MLLYRKIYLAESHASTVDNGKSDLIFPVVGARLFAKNSPLDFCL